MARSDEDYENRMTAEDMEGLLESVLNTVIGVAEDAKENGPVGDDTAPPELANARVRPFESMGMMTRDRGLVLTLADKTSFQITIVRRG